MPGTDFVAFLLARGDLEAERALALFQLAEWAETAVNRRMT